jgi:hypothetical protein
MIKIMKTLLTNPLLYINGIFFFIIYFMGKNVISMNLDYGTTKVMILVAVIFISCFLCVGGLYLGFLGSKGRFDILVFVFYFFLALIIILLGFMYVEYMDNESLRQTRTFFHFVLDNLN